MLSSSPDVQGQALSDYFLHGKADPLLLHTSYGTVEEMPVDWFFRDEEDFPELEQYALTLCHGKVLDIGAGVGSHALSLQDRGLAVTGLEMSTLSANVMKRRGVQRIVNTAYQQFPPAQYDSLLLLMNGIGLVGTLAGLAQFLSQAPSWLAPGGQLIFDSSDIAYLYEEGLPTDHYYGEIRYQYEYQGQRGEWFPWLYVDADTLLTIATAQGWHGQVVYEENTGQYLMRLRTGRSRPTHTEPPRI